MRLIQTRDYQRKRWNNDGGWTTEIAREPLADSSDGFRWRVSIADIEADGPFSRFPGIDRDLLLLAGKGIELDIDDAPSIRLDRRFQSIRFDGEAAIQCRLLAGPTRDFNVMAARAQVSAEVHARPLAGTMLVFVEPRCSWLIHVFAGQASARGDDQSVSAQCGETLILDAPIDARARVVIEGGGELILVKFTDID
ncbi:MAG: HutD family protein [Xanthomonadales bacterium]|nr:HutD family protein [Xanthomonadales bacterium]